MFAIFMVIIYVLFDVAFLSRDEYGMRSARPVLMILVRKASHDMVCLMRKRAFGGPRHPAYFGMSDKWYFWYAFLSGVMTCLSASMCKEWVDLFLLLFVDMSVFLIKCYIVKSCPASEEQNRALYVFKRLCGWAKPRPPLIGDEFVSTKAHRCSDILIEQCAASTVSLGFIACAPVLAWAPEPGLARKLIFPNDQSISYLSSYLAQNTVQDFFINALTQQACEEDLLHVYRTTGIAFRMRVSELLGSQWIIQQMLRAGWFFHHYQIGAFAD